MSSILKALRKLEEEKAALGEGGVDLARDILKRSAPKRDSKSPQAIKGLFFGLFLVVLVLVAVFIFSLFKPTSHIVEPTVTKSAEKSDLQVKQSVNAAPVIKDGGSAPSAVSTTPEKDIPPAVQSTVATEQVSIPQKEETVRQELVLPLAIEAVAEPGEAYPQVENIVEADIPTAPAETEELPQEDNTIVITDLPSKLVALKVDMIAFKPEPNERLAVINDLPVMEGTMVDDVLILEIMKKGVQVVWKDQTYRLPFEDQPVP